MSEGAPGWPSVCCQPAEGCESLGLEESSIKRGGDLQVSRPDPSYALGAPAKLRGEFLEPTMSVVPQT